MPGKLHLLAKVAAGAVTTALLAAIIMTPSPGGKSALAAASDVRLAAVDCAGSPEVVEVKNFGNEGQDLTGWQLQSDGDAAFDLTPAGTIPAGGSIFIESGANAQATFTWSQSQIFRDNDASDYARLVDNTGTTRGQTACGQAAVSPTPTPTPSPTPAAGGVPNGGGRPGPSDGLLSPAMFIYAGGSIIGAVVGLSATWMGVSLGLDHKRRRRRSSASEAESGKPHPLARPAPAAQAIEAAPDDNRAWRPELTAQPLLLALIVALVAAILVALMQSPDSTRRR